MLQGNRATSKEADIKAVALNADATRCGIASVSRLKSGPPSADPTYVMPEAQWLTAYKIAFDDKPFAQFMAKEASDPFVKHKKGTGNAALQCQRYAPGASEPARFQNQYHIHKLGSPLRPSGSDPSEARTMMTCGTSAFSNLDPSAVIDP